MDWETGRQKDRKTDEETETQQTERQKGRNRCKDFMMFLLETKYSCTLVMALLGFIIYVFKSLGTSPGPSVFLSFCLSVFLSPGPSVFLSLCFQIIRDKVFCSKIILSNFFPKQQGFNYFFYYWFSIPA